MKTTPTQSTESFLKIFNSSNTISILAERMKFFYSAIILLVMLLPFKLFAQQLAPQLNYSCTSITDPCYNLIKNGGFEDGPICYAAKGIALHYAECWDITPTTNLGYWTCDDVGTNTPDILDSNVPSNNDNCSPLTNSVGIPHSFVSHGEVNVHLAGTHRYVHLLSDGAEMGESMVGELNSSLESKIYLLEFYIARPEGSCASYSAETCVKLVNGTTPSINMSVGTFFHDLQYFTSGEWRRVTKCVDLTSGAYSGLNRICIQHSNGDPVIYDDFSLRLLADAGPDITFKCGVNNIIGSQCPPIDGATYSWSPATGLSCTNCSNPICTATTTTTYTLTVTSPDGNCTATDQVIVTVKPLPPTFDIIGDRSNCNPLGSTYSPNAVITDYDWEYAAFDGNGYQVVQWTDGSTFNHHFENNCNADGYVGSICFRATDKVSDCSTVSCLNVSYCCNPTGANIIYDNTSSALYGSGDKIFDNSTSFIINGVFTVNTNVTFNGTNIKFAPNAKIVVTNGKKLEANSNAWLHNEANCCAVMWDGIYADGTGNVIKIDGSTVQDAQNAIVSSNGATYTIKNGSVLNLNYKNIIVNPYYGTHPGTISNSKIQCVDSYGQPITINLAPHIGERTYEGIEINQVLNITIGDITVNSGNTFYNMDLGIRSVSSNITVKNCAFDHITTNNYLCSPCLCKVGTAICSYSVSSNTTVVGGSGTYDKCTFTNGTRGISASGKVMLNATYNFFTGISNAISATNSPAGYFSYIVSNNTFQDFTTGINFTDIYGTSNLQTVLIQNNIFNTSAAIPTGTFAIQVQTTNPQFVNLTISGNTIDYCRTGIKLFNVKSFFINSPVIISSNTIHFTHLINSTSVGGIKHYGIRTQGGNGIDIKLNLISTIIAVPDGTTDHTLIGISVENTPGVHVRKNGTDIDKLRGLGDGVFVLGDCNGAYLDCNIFDKCYDGFHFAADASTGLGTASIMTELLNNAQGNQWTTMSYAALAGAISPTVDWYYKLLNPANNPIPLHLATGSLYTNNTKTTTNNDPCSTGGLKEEDDASGDSAVFRSEQFGNIVSSNIDYTSNAEGFQNFDNTYYYSTMSSDSNLLNLGFRNDFLYQKYFDTLSIKNIGAFQKINDLIGTLEFDSAYSVNNAITVNSDIDANRKSVNEIYIRLLQQSLLTASDSSTLLNIAKQDPLVAGDAVYSARVILNYDPDGSTERNAFSVNSQTVSPVQVYPNPANDELLIENSLRVDLTYEVISIEGNLLLEGEIKETQVGKTIPIKLLKPGIYILKVIINNQLDYRTKFIVAR